jgi:phosphoribosyl-ATP pyrophosphohydrolase/phosphoribosyl-AMP cyclohydrolase
MSPDELRFDAQGLIPAVVQETDTGEVLMVAWMDRSAVDATLTTGLSHFWSRSRKQPWRKGETSGHAQHVERMYADCDADVLLVQVHQDGVACHTGNRTCFFTALHAGPPPLAPPRAGEGNEKATAPAGMLERLERTIAARKVSGASGSYVAGLLAKGEATICRKIGEEAAEVMTAALGGEGNQRLVEETADLWFHTLVLLGARGIPLRDVLQELARRHRARQTSPGRV